MSQDSIISSKQFAFKTLTINDGLSQNSVISIAQDSIGHLWLATQDGLNKYDGRHFTYYDKQFEDITRSTFSKLGKIYIDKQNRLWIITHSGKLELYQPKTDDFKHIKLPHSISTVFQDKVLNMYLGTYDHGLLKIDAKTKDTVQIFKDTDINKTVYDYIEVNNDLIIATSGAVYKYQNHSYIEITVSESNNPNFSSLEEDSKGTIWLGTFGEGLFLKPLNQDFFIKFHHKDLPPDLNIEDILVDKKDRVWIATYGNGVYLIDLRRNVVNNFTANKTNPFAIHYNDMLCIYQDATGIIWFGSDGTGASYYDEHLIKFNILTNNQVPKNVNVDMVRSITTDNLSNLWIGTSGKGLTYFDVKLNTYKTFTTNNSSIASNRVISLNFNNNVLWIGHQGYGLNSLDASGNYKFYPELSKYTIWQIVEASENQLWLCTERNGILLFDKNQGIVKKYNSNNSNLKGNNVRVLITGNDNTLWIGTDNDGVFKLDKHTNKISKIDNLADKIKTLYFSNNILWVGTNGSGLKTYNIKNKKIKTYTTKDGLPNDVVYSILPDNHGSLWLSTNNGICRFDPQNPDNNFENFTVYDGLQSTEFNTGAYFKDQRSGILYFGGLEGVNWFSPEQLTYNTTKPKTIISKFEIFSKERPLINNANFKSDENTMTFTFSSLHFSQPNRNLFKYKLENHDKDWINSNNHDVAHYTNLPPNNYIFKVISCSYDGVWNETPATYTFTIKQPWYFSTLAIIIYILLFIIVSFAIYYYLKWRWHMKMQLQFKNEETKRLKKLNKFKTRLYTNLSHEFRTPLTLITGPIENQLQKTNLSNEDRKELTLVQRNSHRLLNLVNQLLDLAKLESGNLTLSVSKGNLVVLLKQLVIAFEFKAKEKKIDYSYNIQTIDDAWFDPDIIEKIVSNLLSNAIKYTPEKGKIYFESTIQNGQLIVSIINNGNTIPDSEISKLFQRYYQTNKTTDGVGIGLSLVKELCILSHGNIVAHTMNNDEIQFTITLPIERSFYSTSEITDNALTTHTIHSPISDKENSIETEIENNKDKPVLLIVEDDDDIRDYVITIFRHNYTIKEAVNGEQGIKSAIKHIPDIIISDVMMPKVNGVELCNTLKHDQRTSHIPIILLTAKSGDKNEIKGLKTGADDYILKPFNSKKLKIRVKKLIELRQQLQKLYSNTFELNDLISTSADQVFFQNLKDVLDKNIINPEFNAQNLSNAMLMSRMQLHRKLKALTNLSTTEFIRAERLKLAKTLLEQNNSTISEIAYQVGFNTPSYFIKCFKEAYNCTPSGYASK
ncbi:histidine kinase [Pseudalgibacter alginicilyticus]|uniref:histidine kinase n=1 Tax=Pseudalgibacter alginicilyticus TaxID=1736674 RepID=A0A0P0D942_9FLAO|nr:histidine kinase [Pseudalgibacter alginicilyticus]